MNHKITSFLLIIYLLCEVFAEEKKIRLTRKEEDTDNTFIPTHEWQVVKKGQAIPKGLHVRINLETGLTEAKLLESSETTKNNALLSVSELEEDENSIQKTDQNDGDEKIPLSSEELKQLLKKIKHDDDESDVKRVQENFKSYDQLKEELSDVNLSVKTDVEILRDIFKTLKDLQSDTNLEAAERNFKILYILQDLEYLVHQIDNANEFVDLNGFVDIIYIGLNSTDLNVKRETLNILGSTVQNNAKAQIQAFETGAVDKVLKMLALDNDIKVKMRAVYALSNLLRRFPLAQKNFIANGGLNVFTNNFIQSTDGKLHLKIITLIYDLLVENKDAHYYVNSYDYEEKLRQYASVNFKNKFSELGWCKLLSMYFINNFSAVKNDHDLFEVCLNVLLLVTDTCSSIFKDENFKAVLQELYKSYELLSAQEEQDNSSEEDVAEHSSYFANLKSLVSQLLQHFKPDKVEL